MTSTASETDEDSRAFLQQRMAAFGLLLGVIFGGFLSWRVISTLVGEDPGSRAYLPWQVVTVAAFLSLWRIGRGRPRSHAFLRWSELAALVIAASAAISMTAHMTYLARPDTVLLLCLSYTLITRAIMVPSSARRTFWLGASFALPFVLCVFLLHYWRYDPSIYTAKADPRLHVDAFTMARRWTVVGALWWAASLAISTATSRVIYGLRKEVRDARRLGQYTLSEKLGEGGMGVVYLAKHALLRRPSAIKLLPPDRLGAESAARFEREVQLTASLSHPNTVRVFDYGRTPDGVLYYAMEYLEGASLDELVARFGPLPPARVIHILAQIAGALGEAHGIGLIHRDIKPANIFLTQQGGVPDVAKVLDFGLVKELGHARGEAETVQALTLDDRISGTPLYMAPESIRTPAQIDARSDLYSLGAVGYYLLTGLDVFPGSNMMEICGHHMHTVPTPPSQRVAASIPADLERVILSCLQKTADARPASAAALRAALLACELAGSWSEQDARGWFAANGEALRARAERGSLSGGATIAVDLGPRLA